MLARRIFAAVVATLALAYVPGVARANGRFPKAQAIVTVPGSDAGPIVLRATFGLVVSKDGGKTWRWTCEQAMGFSSSWDPPIAMTRDGRLHVALADGLRSTLDGCAFDDAAPLHGELVGDLTVDARGDTLYAVTSSPGAPSFVWRSASGAAPERLGKGIRGFRFDTIEVAPSKPARLYLTGVADTSAKRAHFFRSDDGGATIVETSPALPNDGRLYVSAVAPNEPDRVFVRQLSDTGSDVLLSNDGGKTFKSVLHVAGAMFGFTRTPDGKTYYAGSGDPSEGLQRSDDRGEHWTAVAKTSVFCLHATTERLFVCSNPFTPGGFAIGESRDRGATVRALATFDDVAGPVACDHGAGALCAKTWPETRALLQSQGHDREPAIDALDASAIEASAPPASPAPSAKRSSCACDVVGAGGDHANHSRAFAIFILVAILTGARRRQHAGSHTPHDDARAHHLFPTHGPGSRVTQDRRRG